MLVTFTPRSCLDCLRIGMSLFAIVVDLCNDWHIIIQFICQVSRTLYAVTCVATEIQMNVLKHYRVAAKLTKCTYLF